MPAGLFPDYVHKQFWGKSAAAPESRIGKISLEGLHPQSSNQAGLAQFTPALVPQPGKSTCSFLVTKLPLTVFLML